MIKLTELLEKKMLPKNKWIQLSGKDLADYKQNIFDLIQLAYTGIGHPNYKSPKDITDKDAQVYRAIDLNNTPDDAEAVRVIKKKPAGNKLVAMGHDGTSLAKKTLIKYTIDLLNKKGYYAEVSGRVYDVLKSHVHIITDEETVKDVLQGKKIKWLKDGWYERGIGGETHKKIMIGHPKGE